MITASELTEKIDNLLPGVVLRLENVPEQIYHNSEGLGSTSLKRFVDCPAKYRAFIDGKLAKEGAAGPPPHFLLGSATHCRILEPERFDSAYRPLPETIKTRRGAKWDTLQAENPGVSFLSVDDFQKALDMSGSVLGQYSELFTGGASEVSYWKRCEITGLVLKGRADYQKSSSLVIDLKTAASAKPAVFQKKAVDFGYYLQAALYGQIMDVESFLFCVVETEPPYLCTLNAYTDEDKNIAIDELNGALTDLKECIKTGYFPGYSEHGYINDLKIPHWKRAEIDAKC